MRVTSTLMTQRVLTNLNRQTSKLLDLQESMATGLRVNRPSDDPMATRLGIDTRTAIGENEQYLENIDAAGPQLTESTSAIETAYEYLSRAGELAAQGANGTYSQSQRDAIAIEVNQVLEGLVAAANSESNGRFLFAGTRTLSPAYGVTRDASGNITAVNFLGNDEEISVTVGDGVRVTSNVTGNDVFQSDQDVFQLLINIRDNLKSGDQTSLSNLRLSEVKTAKEQLLQSLSQIGAVQNRLERATTDIEGYVDEYKALLSDTIEADYTESLVTLTAQSNAYQAALNAAARVLQPSLLDFLS